MKVRHPEFVLAAATAVCLPMVPGLLSGAISPVTAAERFLLALMGCWFLGSVVSWVIRTYTDQSRRAEIIRLTQGSFEEPPNRRPADPESDQD